jgi:hypothetical protein
VANNLHATEAFWLYVKSEWLPKIRMWVVGYHNLPHARQDINATIENYHLNLRSSFHSSKGFHGRRVDWAIHALVGDVLLHY